MQESCPKHLISGKPFYKAANYTAFKRLGARSGFRFVKKKPGWMRRVPGIMSKTGTNDLSSELSTEAIQRFHIEVEMMGAITFKISHAEFKKPRSWSKAFAILRMRRTVVLLLQMDKGPCNLDQTFEIKMILVLLLQPEMLQDIVGLIIFLLIEALEIAHVAGVKRKRRPNAEFGNKRGDTFAFFHACNFLV